MLTETNAELKKELALPKDGGGTSENVESLEEQLDQSDLRLQHQRPRFKNRTLYGSSREQQKCTYWAMRNDCYIVTG